MTTSTVISLIDPEIFYAKLLFQWRMLVKMGDKYFFLKDRPHSYESLSCQKVRQFLPLQHLINTFETRNVILRHFKFFSRMPALSILIVSVIFHLYFQHAFIT